MIFVIYNSTKKVFRLDFGNLNIAHPYRWQNIKLFKWTLSITFGKETHKI